MADNLQILGKTYTNVAGIKAVNSNGDTLTFVKGEGGGGSESGTVVVASGEFIGNSAGGRQTISIGTAMPQTDFYVLIKAKDNSEYIRDDYYSLTFIAMTVLSAIGHYDLSSDGEDRSFVPNFSVYDNNNGSLTEKSTGFIVKGGGRIHNGNADEMVWNTFRINRRSDTFELYFGQGNAVYNLPSNITYEYEVVYFGNNPQTDIIEL